MKTLFGVCLLLILLSASYVQSQPVKIPRGSNILIDAKISDGEWGDAKKIAISDSASIYFKADKNYIYIATQVADGNWSVADLYYSDAGKMVNLHASAKLGQRNFTSGKWENWAWWNNSLWAANVSKFDSFESRNFLDDSVREFQIDKRLFSKKGTELFFEITTESGNKGNTVITYPAKATRDKADGWLKVSWK